VGFTMKTVGLRFLMRTEVTCKPAKLWCLHVLLVVEMTFINLLECQRPRLRRSVSMRSPGVLLYFFLTSSLYKHLQSTMQVCYVAFWDEITLAAQESQGHRIGEDHFIGKWRVVVVRDLPFADQRLNGKIPKVSKLYAIILLSCSFLEFLSFRHAIASLLVLHLRFRFHLHDYYLHSIYSLNNFCSSHIMLLL